MSWYDKIFYLKKVLLVSLLSRIFLLVLISEMYNQKFGHSLVKILPEFFPPLELCQFTLVMLILIGTCMHWLKKAYLKINYNNNALFENLIKWAYRTLIFLFQVENQWNGCSVLKTLGGKATLPQFLIIPVFYLTLWYSKFYFILLS